MQQFFSTLDRAFKLFCTFTVLFFLAGFSLVFSFDGLPTIYEGSSTKHIKTVQQLFTDLKLYTGDIDGKFSSVKKSIIDFQVKNKVIPNSDAEDAGYFGPKTRAALARVYPKAYTDLANKYNEANKVDLQGDRYFEVSAYYSPIPGQKKYVYGSYQREIAVNGKGTHTASGKPVQHGALAAPRSYSFGTKIYIEGYGTGVVLDRGGAIKGAGATYGSKVLEHDRIDVWMGYGDAARERTVNWGRRVVKGKVLGENAKVELPAATIQSIPQPTKNTSTKTQEKIEKYKNLRIDAENPNPESVKELQKLLKEVGLYTGKIDGIFTSVKEILINFQLANGVITTAQAEDAGYFGKRTHAAFIKKYPNILVVDKKDESKEIEDTATIEKKKTAIFTDEEKQNLQKVKEKIYTLAEAKSNNDKTKQKAIVLKFKERLKELVLKSTNEKQKAILLYVSEIL